MTDFMQPATVAQRTLIDSLYCTRDTPVAGSTFAEAYVLERCFDNGVGKFISYAEALDCIAYLRTRPPMKVDA